MKKLCLCLVVLITCSLLVSAADDYEHRMILANVNKVMPPKVVGKYIIFTQAKEYRHVGIAFEFEDYKIVHSFERIPFDNQRNNRGMLFYILDIPEHLTEIHYRVELDGLWTSDPLNANTFYDYTLGLSVSSIKVPFAKNARTKILENGCVQFYFEGTPGQIVHLGGSFNNWDPFMYEMQEVNAGEYYLSLPIPRGSWTYAFFVGSNQIHDKTNHKVVFSSEGKKASLIEIN